MGYLKSRSWVILGGAFIVLAGGTWIVISKNTTDFNPTLPLVSSVANNVNPVVQKKTNVIGQLEVFSIDEAVKNADLIAEVEITGVVEELDDPLHKTIFSAVIGDAIKGDLSPGTAIHIMQQGNSKTSFNENPLFETKDKYVLVLKKAVGMNSDHTYWILGEETGVFEELDDKTLVKWTLPDKKLKPAEVSVEQDSAKKPKLEKIKEKVIGKDTHVIDKEKLKNIIKDQMMIR